MKLLVSGAAGFIGMATASAALARGDIVLGLDNLNDYYDPALKNARLEQLENFPNFTFQKLDVADFGALLAAVKDFAPDGMVHLAAQAGVQHSLSHPHDYLSANLAGFLNILEAARAINCGHLVFASSSSVYGNNNSMPYKVSDGVDHPVSLYAASKKANEVMAHSYAHLYGLPMTGLRFFTVYGPWGRPDMSPMIFARKILAGEVVELFNFGKHSRDFTYIDDIVDGILGVVDRPATASPDFNPASPDPSISSAPYRIHNIGNTSPIQLMDFIGLMEEKLGKKANISLLPMRAGDVPDTYADVSTLNAATGYQPKVDFSTGIGRFVDWYLTHQDTGIGF